MRSAQSLAEAPMKHQSSGLELGKTWQGHVLRKCKLTSLQPEEYKRAASSVIHVCL